MPRFAAHYLYHPDAGLFSLAHLEIGQGGEVVSLQSLSGEPPSTIWLQGCIALFPTSGLSAKTCAAQLQVALEMYSQQCVHPGTLSSSCLSAQGASVSIDSLLGMQAFASGRLQSEREPLYAYHFPAFHLSPRGVIVGHCLGQIR